MPKMAKIPSDWEMAVKLGVAGGVENRGRKPSEGKIGTRDPCK